MIPDLPQPPRRPAKGLPGATAAMLGDVFDQLAEGVVVVDADGHFMLLNRKGSEIVGSDPTRLQPTGFPDVQLFTVDGTTPLEPQDWPIARAARGEVVEETLRVTSPERPAGVFVRVRAIPFLDEAGHRAGALAVFEDITEKRRLESRLRDSEKALAAGNMASYVAHELNNPLANIALITTRAMQLSRDPEIVARLKRIEAQRRLAADIVSSLLDYSRPMDLRWVEMDLRDLVRDAVDSAEPFATPNVALVIDASRDPVRARVDPVQLREVLLNLLRNAFQATRSGTVTVHVGSQDGARVIAVEDTGSGIPAEVRNRIFEPFFTTKPHGTGLGLAYCKRVVQALGGTIALDSLVGRGSTFTVLLPSSTPSGDS